MKQIDINVALNENPSLCKQVFSFLKVRFILKFVNLICTLQKIWKRRKSRKGIAYNLLLGISTDIGNPE